MATSTRLTQRYRDHLRQLRTLAYQLESSAECNELIDAIDGLAGDLAMGFAPTEEVALPASPGAYAIQRDERRAG